MTNSPSISPVPITPLAIPASITTILLVGGTFDPPHLAHAQMAEAARLWLAQRWQTHSSDRNSIQITFVPAARSPFKPPPIASDADRVDMLRAMAAAMPSTSVWTDEIDRARPGQPSYWVDTLRRAHEALAPRLHVPAQTSSVPSPTIAPPELCFLIGADQAIALHRWRDPRRILELARPVIVARAPVSTPDLLTRALRDAALWGEGEIEYFVSRLAPCDLSDISATAIRTELASAEATRRTLAQSMVVPGVARIIESRGLYRRRA